MNLWAIGFPIYSISLPPLLASRLDIPAYLATFREGGGREKDELSAFLSRVTSGKVDPEQLGAWLMAAFLVPFDADGTAALTQAMAESGERISFDAPGFVVDKHSTGGVGDSTTLVLLPWLAAIGLFPLKISGRGLGFTGGTLDKLESLPGFSPCKDEGAFARVMEKAACAIGEASKTVAPADAALYPARDITSTVASLPLEVASILSKKIAVKADALVLDVKCGEGSFSRTEEEGAALADALVKTASTLGRPTSAIVSLMDSPLGCGIGNLIEVKVAAAVLEGLEESPLLTLTRQLALSLLDLAGVEGGDKELEDALQSGRARECLDRWIDAQGGNPNDVNTLSLAPSHEIRSPKSGWVQSMGALPLAQAVRKMGGGRIRKGDPINHHVGIRVHRRVGMEIERGERILTIYGEPSPQTSKLIEGSFKIGPDQSPERPLVQSIWRC
ncbi:thymidine phosphorylase [bacterium]|nr:thymidine phosphorylase [bacterium]